jgi:hypothetical protein
MKSLKSMLICMKSLKKISLLIWAVCLGFLVPMVAQKPVGTYYVGANAGLNMRATANASGEKLGLALYGEAVEILAPAKDASMVVDGIKGGMAQVKHEGKTGYMFDGYLLRHPAPDKGEEVDHYAGRLWESQADILHENLRRDWGGYAQFTYAIYFKEISWSEAFVIAKNLFGIPVALQYPGEQGIDTKTVKNPNPAVEAWTDELQAGYGTSGKLKSISYVHRGEGGGQVITVEPSPEKEYQIKISLLNIAD